MTIHTIDLLYLGIPQSIAAYVVMGPGGPVLIETGPASTLQHLIDGLARLDLRLEDIRHAIVTHIHLDHAGAAGHLARNGTQIYVHEFGARHLIDPARLIESATRIYGDQMDRLWGQLLPVPAAQVTPVHDGDMLDLCGVRLQAIETPGHARHHHALALGDVCFAGDVAGISVPGVPEPPVGRFVSVPTPPPEFDLIAWQASLDRIRALDFREIYLTHYGARRNVAAHLDRLRVLLGEHAEFVRRAMQQGISRERVLSEYIQWNRQQASEAGIDDQTFARYVSINLLTMNVDGIMRYWSRQPGVLGSGDDRSVFVRR